MLYHDTTLTVQLTTMQVSSLGVTNNNHHSRLACMRLLMHVLAGTDLAVLYARARAHTHTHTSTHVHTHTHRFILPPRAQTLHSHPPRLRIGVRMS